MRRSAGKDRSQTVRRGRPGVTLVELVVSLAIMVVLLAGLTSAIVVAAHALPSRERSLDQLLDGAWIADQMAEEMEEALWLLEHTATAVTFTVADRDGDGVPERIRYAWSGSAGGSLTRQYNAQDPVTALANVHEFALAYDTTIAYEDYPGPPVEGSESQLCNYEGYGSLRDYDIEKTSWPGELLSPSLPGDTVCWRVTRAYVAARRDGSTYEQVYAQIRPTDADGKPTDTVLAQVTLSESDWKSYYDWVQIPFSNAGGLSPGQTYALVLQHSGSGNTAGNIFYDYTYGDGRIRYRLGTWTVYPAGSLWYYIYGKASTPGPTQTIKRYYVNGVRITLRAGDGTETRVTTATRTLNLPEVLSAMWECDFSTDPTVDLNGDGAGDWLVSGGASFDEATLGDGLWRVSSELLSNPTCNFNRLTTIEVRFRCTATSQDGATVAINADWSGSQCAPITANIRLENDDTQTLTVKCVRSDLANVVLFSRTGLPDDLVTLRMIVDPVLNAVHVEINGNDQGTYAYDLASPGYDKRYVTLKGSSSSCRFDYVSVRVAE
ncbi:MAG: prepilin-type N-terminal cleavage/methylation domain-containing protein [Phycisphaerae bacterium]|jgi:hypothetical protein